MGKFEKPRTPRAEAPKKPKPTAAEKKAAPKKSGAGKVWLVCALVVAALVVGLFAWAKSVVKNDTIFPNVFVAGVNVGGMSKTEAKAAVEDAVTKTYGSSELTVKLPDRTLTFSPADLAVTIDSDKAVQDAWEYGRDKGMIEALKMRLGGASGEHFVDISDGLTMNSTLVRSKVQAVADEVKSQRKDSSYDLSDDKHAITIHVGTSARSLDVDSLCGSIETAVMMGDFSAISADYQEEAYAPVDLSALHGKLCIDKADAYYDKATKSVVAEVVGYGFDAAAAQQQQAMAKEGTDLTITLQADQPEVTKASLEAKLFHDVLGSCDSPYPYNPNRTNNLKLACQAINGTILNPGETFSFNDTVGERTAAKGYTQAIVYVSGQSKPELGGGVCQVASTIYTSTLLADLDVVERAEHMFFVTYVDPGMDATVYWGYLDYKFKNSTGYPLRIDASVSDGYCHIKLVGTKEKDTTVKMSYEILATIPWTDVTKEDESKPASYREVTVTPYTGYKVQTYKQYFDKDGKAVGDKIKVAYSVYKKRDRETTVGKQPEETTTTPAETTAPALTTKTAATTKPTETTAAPTETTAAPTETTEPVLTEAGG